MLYAIFALIVIIVDQWVKFWVASNLVVDTDVLGFIPGFVSLVNVHNEGAAFGFLSSANAKLFLVGLACVFALIVIIGLATRLINGPIGRWSAVLVAAGGLSNAIDRLLYGYVQDMFRFDFVDFAVFNVADIFITVFCVFFIIDLIFGGENGLFGRKRRDEDEEEVEDEEEEAPAEKPAKKAKKEKKASRRAAVEEDEDDEEEDVPVRRKAAAKKAAPDTDYDEYKSRKKAKPESKPEPETDYAALEAARKAAEQEEAQRRAQQAAAAEAAARQAAEAKAAAAAAKPAAAKPAAPASDDLDLEAILREFQ